MLPPRRENVLKIIVGEYISSALPVGSERIARSYPLGVSPATIRNDMVRLEEEGFITQPHTSSGRVPLDKGYRYYVESLMEKESIPTHEQEMIRRQFHQSERELERLIRLAASVLARIANNVAIITLPKTSVTRFKHLELVSLQEFLALLILVLQEAKVRQITLPLERHVSQEHLGVTAHKLSQAFSGLSAYQIANQKGDLSPLEEQVTQAVVHIMEEEDLRSYEEPHIEGLRNLLTQPEFASSERVLAIMKALEEKNVLEFLALEVFTDEGIKVVIGRENPAEIMHHCSMVIAPYGIPGQIAGAVGVLGPTRMRYPRVISSVHFLSQVMSQHLAERFGY